MVIPDVSSRSLNELISLAGRRAVVTGGGRGLGKAIALRLAEAGADVLIGDIDESLAAGAAKDLGEHLRGRALGTFLDVADTATVKTAADLAVEQFGGIDIWVNNAGIFPAKPILDMSDETWDKVFAVNARGVFASSREAARRMVAADSGGVIVNVASTAGFRGSGPGLAAYVGSKHAVRGVTRQMALELAQHGIRVLGVAPTYVPTEGNQLAAGAINEGDEVPAVMMNSLIGRMGVPDDIARAVLFCACDLSIFMTGSTLLLDAGNTA